ncbi:LysR substrate-binding domain-containing protein [Pandoraea sp. PE-S2T-3]|uniref:LysR substrate-binding domain-containing protein n=1 Tax=Pandoraea sp. PE-S2T-3 TaxID=1986993 RepID=UPI000B402176|nr:LysR substrate-binding domain-containing protein [Pandoraea sp. PE-S2T-3]
MKTLPKHLPPLPALRAFEAVARLGSVSRAADELHVTKGAVSQQIKALELDIGGTLLRRGTRDQKAEPTELGTEFLKSVQRSLGLLEIACRETRLAASGCQRRRLSLSANASFSALWLVPRIGRFMEQRPDIDIEVHLHTNQNPSWKTRDIDLAFLHINDRGSRVAQADDVPLVGETIVPVCSPSLISRSRHDDPALFTRHRLIAEDHAASPETSWNAWLDRMGVATSASRDPLILHGMSAVVSAAVSGVGIALGRTPLIDEEVAARRLVVLVPDLRLAGSWRYVMRRHPERAPDEAVMAFVEFCGNEAALSR